MVNPVVVQCCFIVRDWAIIFGVYWNCVVCDVRTVDYRATAAVRCAVGCVSASVIGRVSYQATC